MLRVCADATREQSRLRGWKDGRRGAAAAISCIVCAGLSMRRGTSGSSRDVDTLFFSYSRLFERKKLQPHISKWRVRWARGRRANLRMMPSNHMVDDARIPHRLHQAPQA